MSRCYICLEKLDEKDCIKEMVKPSERGKIIKASVTAEEAESKGVYSMDDKPKLLYRHKGCKR